MQARRQQLDLDPFRRLGPQGGVETRGSRRAGAQALITFVSAIMSCMQRRDSLKMNSKSTSP